MSVDSAHRTHTPRRRARSAVVAVGLLAALVVALVPGAALAQRRGSENVAPFVEQQFYDLQTWGDPLAARVVAVDGYSVAELTDYTTASASGFPERHYQGIARNSGPDGTPYLHLTRNRNPNRLCFLTSVGVTVSECFNFGPGEYSVVEMGSRDKTGERMRSNRLAKDAEFEDTLPPELDKFVRSLRFDGRNGMPRAYHPSGIALIDDVLLIGFDTGCGEADQTGLSATIFDDFEVGDEFDAQGAPPIVLDGTYTQRMVCEIVKANRTDESGLLMIDVSDPKNPFIMRTLRPFGGGGTPSVIRRPNGRYLIGDMGGTGANVKFYETNTDDLRTTTSLDTLGNWGVYTHLGCVEKDAELGTDACSDGDRDTIWIGGREYPWPDDAQGFNLVRDQKTNALYAFIFDNNTDQLSDGDDLAVMLRVNEAAIDDWKGRDIMTLLGSKQFEANDAGQGAFSPGIAPMGDFEAAASLYVSPTGQMILYAAMHDGSTLDGKKIVEMGEFRSRYVMAPTPVWRGSDPYQCGVDLPVTVISLTSGIETRIPCAGVGPSCVASGLGLIPEALYPFTYTVDGAECHTCQDASDCVQNYYEAQCGTVFNYDYLPWAQQQFGPGPVYPVTEIGRFEFKTFALPPYALVEPWVMLHDEYDNRSTFTSPDPAMSLMMDWADESKDDFRDLTEFDNPGAGSFNDETSYVTYCATPGTSITLRKDSGGGCESNVLVVKDGDADGVAQGVGLGDEVDDATSCVRMDGSLGKDDAIHWSLDGVPLVLSAAGPEVVIDGAALGPGTHTLTARIWNRTAGATIVVAASNLAPTFAAADPPAVNEDAGARTVAGWAVFDPTADSGEPDEAGQTVVAYTVSAVGNPGLFSAGPAVAADGTLTYTPASNAFGTSTFDVTVQDSGGTANGGVDTSAPRTFTITVRSVNDAPSFTASSPAAVLEDAGAQTVAFATFSAGPANESGQAVAAYTVSDVSVPALFAAGPSVDTTGQLTFTPAANASGSSTFRVRVRDDGGTDRGGADTSPARTFTITVTPVNDPPVPLATGSPATQTVQYSDGVTTVTFSASDIDSPSLTLAPDVSLPEGLSLGAATCTPAATPLVGTGSTCTWALTGRAGASAGTYDLAFTVSDGGLDAATGTQIVVEPEDAQVTIDQANEVALQVAAAGGTSGAFTLAFTLHEVDDPDDVAGDANLAGDITRGEATMTLVPVGPGSPVEATCVEVGTTLLKADPDSPHDYESLRVECTFAGVPVNTYSVEVAVVGFTPLAGPTALNADAAADGLVVYYSASNTVTVTDVLTIFDPSLGFTTGGGWFRWPGTADEATGYAGDKTNVGYTMKYNRRKTNLQGSLLVVRHLRDGSVVRLKSNALEGLSLGRVAGEFGWAAFSGKGTYQAIGWPEALGNYRFTTYVEDHTASGGADRFWVEVTDGSAVVQPDLSLPKPAPARAEGLQGGSIHVP